MSKWVVGLWTCSADHMVQPSTQHWMNVVTMRAANFAAGQK